MPQASLSQSLDDLNDAYDFEYEWIETELVEKEKGRLLNNYAGIWSAHGSPFKSLDGALAAVTFARLKNIQ